MAQFFVTVDHTKVSADLTDFPIYINLANAPASFWSVVKNGGGDIRVYKSDGITELPREVVSCDTGTDTGELHVKFTGTLSASVSTKIVIDVDGRRPDYAPTATFGRNAVWSDYIRVHHGQLTDSSGNANATVGTATSANVSFSSPVGGRVFEKTTNNTSATVQFGGSVSGRTLSAWIRTTDTDNYVAYLFDVRTGITNGWAYLNTSTSPASRTVSHGGDFTVYQNSSLVTSGTTTYTIDTWNLYHFVTSSAWTDNPVDFGQRYTSPISGDSWMGQATEFRITKTASLSTSWITTEYNNQNAPWTFTSWSEQVPKRFALTIDNTKVAADLVDFPFLVDLSIMPAGFWSTVTNGGGDIRVFKQGRSSELPREVASCDTTLKTGELWIKYSGTLSSSAPTTIIIEVDGAKTNYDVTASFGRNAVWSDYRAVYHLNHTSGNATDATANGFTLTNTTSKGYSTAGKFGSAIDFGSSVRNTTELTTASDILTSNGSVTMSLWFKQNTSVQTASNPGLFHLPYKNASGAVIAIIPRWNAGAPDIQIIRRTSSDVSATTSFGNSTSAWYHVVAVYDSSLTKLYGYLDGAAFSTTNVTSTGTFNSTAYPISLGGSYMSNNATALVDEVRVTTLARSSQWVTTEYNNQNANSTFFSSIAETGQSGWLNIATGTYTGTGGTSGTRAITGIGFRPKFVLVWSSDTAEIYPAFSIDTAITGLGANIAFLGENGWGTSSVSDRFNSFDADGFTISIGSSSTTGNKALNKNAATFYYLALGGPDIVTGSYTGNATDNRNITGVGFLATFLMLMGGTNHSVTKFLSSGASTDTSSWIYNAADSADLIQNITDDGFQIGTATQVNANTIAHYWMAIKSGPKVFQSQYTGDAVDNRAITEPGFQPDFVYIKSSAAKNFGLRSSNHSGDLSKFYRSSGLVANYIQSLDATGFTIGNAADINTSSETLRYIAFQDEITYEVAVNETITITESVTPDVSNLIRRENSVYVSAASATSHSFSFTVSTRPNRLLVVWSIDRLSNAASQISSVTYAGNNLTFGNEFETARANFGHGTELWYQFNPTSGSNTLQINYSPAQGTEIWVIEYSGVKQSDFASINSGYQFDAGVTVSANVTTTKVGQWILSPAILNRAFSSGSNFVRPQTPVSNLQYGDTNGPVSVGLTTVSVTQATTPSIGLYSFALEPFENPLPTSFVNVFDQITITELVTAVRTGGVLTVSVNDTLTITESTTQQRSTFASVVDAVAITENVNPNRIFNLTVNDAVLITESVTRQQALVTSVFDAIGITENITTLRSINVSTSDTITVTESVSRLSTLFATATENVTILESVTQQKINVVNVFDTVSIGELTIQAIVLVRSVSDTLTISESVTLERPVTSIQLPQDRYKGTAKRINMKVGGSI